MADTTTNEHDYVTRAYLDVRLSELEARIDVKLADLKIELSDRIAQAERRMLTAIIGLFGPLLIALVVAVIIQ